MLVLCYIYLYPAMSQVLFSASVCKIFINGVLIKHEHFTESARIIHLDQYSLLTGISVVNKHRS